MPETKIVFCVLTTYEREGWVHPSILQFFCDMPFQKGFAYRMIPVHNFKPAAAGRNVVAQHLKDTDADWICMIDNDMQINGNLLDTLKDAPADASIIVPAFYMWTQSELKLTLCWGIESAPTGITKLTPGFHPLIKAGTGVIFIKPAVFKALEYPYFRYLWNADCGLQGTEDIQFCNAALAKGFKIYGNADVKIGHFHSVDLATMYDWAEKTYQLNQNNLDTSTGKAVDSSQKDSGCSPEPNAANSVPVEAQ